MVEIKILKGNVTCSESAVNCFFGEYIVTAENLGFPLENVVFMSMQITSSSITDNIPSPKKILKNSFYVYSSAQNSIVNFEIEVFYVKLPTNT